MWKRSVYRAMISGLCTLALLGCDEKKSQPQAPTQTSEVEASEGDEARVSASAKEAGVKVNEKTGVVEIKTHKGTVQVNGKQGGVRLDLPNGVKVKTPGGQPPKQ